MSFNISNTQWSEDDQAWRFGNSQDSSENVLFLADMALARGIGTIIEDKGKEFLLNNLPSTFFATDAIVFNLECCLSTEGEPWEPKPVIMNGKAAYLDIFPGKPNALFANVANNHFLDLGETGALNTVNELKKRGIDSFGYESADGQAAFSELFLPSGTKLELHAYSPCAHRIPDSKRINITPVTTSEILSHFKQRQTENKAIVSLHQGVEFSPYTDKYSRNLARSLIDAGAECVVCHHTHVLQAIEEYNGKWIFYGIGNFLIELSDDRKNSSAYSLSLKLEWDGNNIIGGKIIPLAMNEYLQPTPLTTEDRENTRQQINRLSRLIANKKGIALRNDLSARILWLKLHSAGAVSMLKRKGPLTMLLYYLKRAIYKLTH